MVDGRGRADRPHRWGRRPRVRVRRRGAGRPRPRGGAVRAHWLGRPWQRRRGHVGGRLAGGRDERLRRQVDDDQPLHDRRGHRHGPTERGDRAARRHGRDRRAVCFGRAPRATARQRRGAHLGGVRSGADRGGQDHRRRRAGRRRGRGLRPGRGARRGDWRGRRSDPGGGRFRAGSRTASRSARPARS